MKLDPDHNQLNSNTNGSSKVTLYNDDENTFDWVIKSLVEVCDHDPIQAEQCAWLVHLRGKCEIKVGPTDKLIAYKEELLKRGLSVEIND